MLDSQKDIITASIPFLEENGVELTAKFYQFMLETHPEVRPFFNKSHQIRKTQPKILAFALLQYATHIHDLTPLLGFVRQIVEKHVGLQVTKEQYAVVGTCLLKTLKEMLGDAATDEFMKSWEVAYWELADLLIQLEKERYEKELEIQDAWLGFKDAKVIDIVQESKDVKSVHIALNDNKHLPKFSPGQYITIRIKVNGEIQSREYSISSGYTSSSATHYRISVKRINGGVVSNHIHDTLQVDDQLQITSPYGKLLENYEKAEKKSNDAVFFIAGIGITPMVSLVEYFAQLQGQVAVYLSNHDQDSRVFVNWLAEINAKYPNLTIKEYLSSPSTLKSSGGHSIHQRLNISDIETPKDDVNYYVVGPKSYTSAVLEALKSVPAENVNTEEFGPITV